VEIYLFMSKTRTVFGFTSHSDGANLPAAFVPWEEAGSITNHTWLATEVTDAIKRDGFYIMPRPQRLDGRRGRQHTTDEAPLI
jgi:hypothetical protein